MSRELIAQSTQCCDVNLEINGIEKSQIHCAAASQPCENAAEALQSETFIRAIGMVLRCLEKCICIHRSKLRK